MTKAEAARMRRLELENAELRAEVERLQRELSIAHGDASHCASRYEEMRAEVEALRENAARYQFLRDQQALTADRATYAVMRWNERAGEWLHIDFKLDPEIDAYLEASQ